jgi:outer membrane protein
MNMNHGFPYRFVCQKPQPRWTRRGGGVVLLTAWLTGVFPLAAAPDAAEPKEPLTLSLEDATLLALQNNREIKVQRFGPALAGLYEQIERGAFDAELYAGFAVVETVGSETARATGEKFDVESADRDINIGLRRRFASGAEVAAEFAHTRSTSDRTPIQEEARIGLTVTQPLLRGLRPAVNLAAVRQAELGVRATRYELRGFAEALVADCETAYWRYVLAREKIGIFEESIQLARRQLDDVAQRIEVGALARNDDLAARTEVARREQALIAARGALEAERLRLIKAVYPDALARGDLGVTATTAPRRDAAAMTNLAEHVSIAERMRPDLNEARLRLEQNRLATVVTRSGVLPRLDLFVALGKTGFADSFKDAVGALDDDTYDVTAGVRFSHFLGGRVVNGRHAAAIAVRDQAAIAIANLADIVRLDVRLAINAAEQVRQQIQASAVTRGLQEKSLQAEQERFELGVSTAWQVAQAQRELLDGRIAEIEAIVDYRIALVKLYLAEGSLLERRGIAIEVMPNGGLGNPP